MGTIFIRLLYFLLPYLVKNSKRFMSDGRSHHTVPEKLRKAYFIIVTLAIIIIIGFGYGGYRYYILFNSQQVLEESVADLRRNQPNSKLMVDTVNQNTQLIHNVKDLVTINTELRVSNDKLQAENRTLRWQLGIDEEGNPIKRKN